MKMKPIKIKGDMIDGKALKRAIRNTLKGEGKAVKVDFDTTTQTFKHRPEFTIDVEDDKVTVATDDEIYGYLDDGTPAHIITAKNPNKPLTFGVGGSPKTAPRVIGSRPGTRGSTIVRAQVVHHPGTAARLFTDEIRDKWDDLLPDAMQRAIDAEL